MSLQNESNREAGSSLSVKESEGEKKAQAILIAAGPEILTIPMPPRPAGVAMAAIVEGSIIYDFFWLLGLAPPNKGKISFGERHGVLSSSEGAKRALGRLKFWYLFPRQGISANFDF